MSLVSRPLLTVLLLGGLLLGLLPRPAPAAPVEPMVVAFRLQPVQPVQTDSRLAQNYRRDNRDRRQIRRNKDWIPYQAPPPRRTLRNNQRQNERGRPRPRPRREQDQDAARDAVRRGEVLALGSIIQSVQGYCPGTFLDASLQRRRNGMFYQVRILRPSGKRVVLAVDARTGAVVGGRCR